MDQAQVQVRFTVEHDDYPPYHDAIYVPIEDYSGLLASGELERMKQARWVSWRESIDNPLPVPEVVDEGPSKAEQLAAITAQLAELIAAEQHVEPVETDPATE